jgi:hypothetical protein
MRSTMPSKKKIRVGCDQKFQLAIREISEFTHKGVNYVWPVAPSVVKEFPHLVQWNNEI